MKKNIIVVFVLASVVAALFLYYSPANRTERNYAAMREEGRIDLTVLDAYIQLHESRDNVEYNRALNQAALVDDRYLQKAVERYASGSFILFTDTAERILSRLPSESVELNLVAGRIYATEEFGMQNLEKAAHYLSYAALRGNDPAAKHLANVYLKSNCPVEAATWASVVNANENASQCERIALDVNQFSEAEWLSILMNADKLLQARATGKVANIEFKTSCSLNNKS
ncbi:MAG TPA: hypothetical protein VIQ03_04750 [Gammaproteobacteria bacterium]